MEMTYSSQKCSSEFKGELIENTLYQSADDVVDCQRDHDDTQSSVKGSLTEPYYKNLQTKSNPTRTLTRMHHISEEKATGDKLGLNTTANMNLEN